MSIVIANFFIFLSNNIRYIGLGFLIFPAQLLSFLPIYSIGRCIMYVALVLTVWSGLDYFYKLRSIFVEER